MTELGPVARAEKAEAEVERLRTLFCELLDDWEGAELALDMQMGSGVGDNEISRLKGEWRSKLDGGRL